jgi:hypothetical protein
MRQRKLQCLALCASLFIFVAGVTVGFTLAKEQSQTKAQAKTLLDNQRVTVTEMTTLPDARREPYTRPTDQIIVFLDEADYSATDAAGQKQIRHRAAGEIIWHNKGEIAPLLINTGKKPYRNLVIALK